MSSLMKYEKIILAIYKNLNKCLSLPFLATLIFLCVQFNNALSADKKDNSESSQQFTCTDEYSIVSMFNNENWKIENYKFDKFIMIFNPTFTKVIIKSPDVKVSAPTLSCRNFGARDYLNPIICKSPLPYDATSMVFDLKNKRYFYNIPSVLGYTSGRLKSTNFPRKDNDITRMGNCEKK